MDNLTQNATVFNNTYYDETMTSYIIIIPSLCAIIMIINLIVVVSSGLILKKDNQHPRATYMFLGNVALSDFLTGASVLIEFIFLKEDGCRVFNYIMIGLVVTAILVSALSVGLIAIDRFIYIIYGLHYNRYINTTRARILILLTWIIRFLPAMGWRDQSEIVGMCVFLVLASSNLVLLICFVGLIPIVMVLILYSIILYKALIKVSELRKARSQLGAESSNNLRIFRGGANQNNTQAAPINKSQKKEPSKWWAIKIVLCTTGSFFFTWMPFLIVSVMYVFCDQQKNPEYCSDLNNLLMSPLTILGILNSVLNPIIYAWCHNGFRKSTKRIYNNLLTQLNCCNYNFNSPPVELSQLTETTNVMSSNASIVDTK